TAISLTGVGVCTGALHSGQCQGNFPTTEASLVTPFELQVAHPLDPTIPAFANIQYVGVAYDPVDKLILFGISMQGPFSSLADVSPSIYVSTHNDGNFDMEIATANLGIYAQDFGPNGGDGNDVGITTILNLKTQKFFPESFTNLVTADVVDTRMFGNNVLI